MSKIFKGAIVYAVEPLVDRLQPVVQPQVPEGTPPRPFGSVELTPPPPTPVTDTAPAEQSILPTAVEHHQSKYNYSTL